MIIRYFEAGTRGQWISAIGAILILGLGLSTDILAVRAGAAVEVGTAGDQCATDEILHMKRSGCLTRTPNFWGMHPEITKQYLEIEVCGITLDNASAGNRFSAIEAMCSTGTDSKILGSQAAQLIRQCTAAKLNVIATTELRGNCLSEFPQIGNVLAACCGNESICTGDAIEGYSIEYCITKLDFFNNTDPDTLNFDYPIGFVNPTACQDARNNGVIVAPM